MSEVKTFFRFCPSCGKRFHIKLVSKKLVDSKRETSEQKQSVRGYGTYGYRGGMGPLVVEENIPVTVDVEDFQYSYKCKHCGHEWTENRVERQKVD
jgi:ribosomal protein L44E